MRRRLLLALTGATLLLVAAVPVVAFGIVPLVVHSTVNEPPPTRVAAWPAAAAAVVPGLEPSPASAVPTPAAPVLIAAGPLRHIDAVHYGAGRVSIQTLGSTRFLRFDEVAIAGAPNMYVYLSSSDDGRPGTFIDLGPLRATNGSFNYELPPGLDLGPVRSVVVWCRAFSVTVTWALLLRA